MAVAVVEEGAGSRRREGVGIRNKGAIWVTGWRKTSLRRCRGSRIASATNPTGLTVGREQGPSGGVAWEALHRTLFEVRDGCPGRPGAYISDLGGGLSPQGIHLHQNRRHREIPGRQGRRYVHVREFLRHPFRRQIQRPAGDALKSRWHGSNRALAFSASAERRKRGPARILRWQSKSNARCVKQRLFSMKLWPAGVYRLKGFRCVRRCSATIRRRR